MNKAPIFQHRHYKAIAAWIDATRDRFTLQERYDLASRFAEFLASDNPRFDRARFLTAANGTPSNGRDKVRS